MLLEGDVEVTFIPIRRHWPDVPRSAKSGPSIINRDFLLLFAATFTFVLSAGVVSPLLPLFARSLGATESVVGIVIGVFSAVGLLTRIPYGGLIDAHGKRRMMMAGAVIYFTAPIFYAFCSDPAQVFLVRAYSGFGMGAFQISATVLAADLAPRERVGETIGLYSVATLLGMAVGPAAGGYVAEAVGFTGSFYVSAACGLLAVACASLVRERRAPSGRRGFALRPALGDRNVVSSAVMMFFVSVSWAAVGVFFPLHAAEQGVAVASIGLFFTTYALTTVVSRPLVGRFSDRLDRGLVILATAGVAVGGMVLLAVGTTFEVFMAAAVVYGIGYGSCYTLISALAVDTVDARLRGSAIAWSYLGKDLGGVTGSMALGFLAQALGFAALFLAVGGLLAVGMAAFLAVRYSLGKHSHVSA